MMASRRRQGSVAHYLSVSPLYLSVSFLFFPSSFTFSVRFTAEFSSFRFSSLFFLFTWVMGSCLLGCPAGLGIYDFWEGGPEQKTKGPKPKFFFLKNLT